MLSNLGSGLLRGPVVPSKDRNIRKSSHVRDLYSGDTGSIIIRARRRRSLLASVIFSVFRRNRLTCVLRGWFLREVEGFGICPGFPLNQVI